MGKHALLSVLGGSDGWPLLGARPLKGASTAGGPNTPSGKLKRMHFTSSEACRQISPIPSPRANLGKSVCRAILTYCIARYRVNKAHRSKRTPSQPTSCSQVLVDRFASSPCRNSLAPLALHSTMYRTRRLQRDQEARSTVPDPPGGLMASTSAVSGSPGIRSTYSPLSLYAIERVKRQGGMEFAKKPSKNERGSCNDS